jgi:hypothetical protein
MSPIQSRPGEDLVNTHYQEDLTHIQRQIQHETIQNIIIQPSPPPTMATTDHLNQTFDQTAHSRINHQPQIATIETNSTHSSNATMSATAYPHNQTHNQTLCSLSLPTSINIPPPPSSQTISHQPQNNNKDGPHYTQTYINITDQNQPSGDILSEEKTKDTLRIYFQNANGISTNKWMDWTHATTLVKNLQIDILGIAETNVNWTEPRRQYAQHILKQNVQQSHISASSSTEVGCEEYQPGGVASCITGKWTGNIIETISDKSGLGRWAGHIIAGKNNKNIVIITAYRPVKATGFLTTYQQQWRILRQQNDPNPTPRQHILKELEKCILTWTAKSYEIILMWDTNEGIDSHKSEINKFMTKTGLGPIHTVFPTATYTRGSTCIDFILATAGIRTSTTRSGYLPFYEGIWSSDHRGLFMDINTNRLFQQQHTTSHTQNKRHISSNNRKQVFKFIKALESYRTLPDILLQLQQLDKLPTWNLQNSSAFESLDRKFTQTLLQAEEACALPNHAAWTPALHECFMIYKYWRIRKSSHSTKKKVTEQLTQIAQTVTEKGRDIHQGNTGRPIAYQLKLAIKNLRNQRADDHDNRKKHLTFRQETLVLEGKKKQAAAIATIKKAERRQNCFRKFHIFTKPPRSAGGIAYTIRSNPDGTTTRIQDPTELAHTLSQRNRKHFAQAHGTPFTVPPLSTSLNFSGVTSTGHHILNGNHTIANTNNKYVNAILAELTQVRDTLPHEISLNAMITGFSKWRETTTTSPSGKHLGIYKSLIQYHRHIERQSTKQTPRERTSLDNGLNIALTALHIQHKIINLAIRHTHTLHRWTTVHNFFIEKIPGTPLLDKLRVIHIYEADWNLILKYFISFTLTNKACYEKTTTDEQAGGRKDKCANDMATNTVMTHEICRLQKLSGAIMYNDAKACFDRIIENISNITCMREGLSPKIASLHAQTLQDIRYHIKTQHGCDESFNKHMYPDPFLGSGQGAGDSMTRWGFLSDAIIRAYNRQAQSFKLTTPISHLYMQTNIQAFVDDSHGLILQDPTKPDQINDFIQYNMQTWESLLHAIGGKLEINKCQIIKFQWDYTKDDHHRLHFPNISQRLHITDSETNDQIQLPELNITNSYKLLGVHMAFDGNQNTQADMFHKKCEALAIAFSRCTLTREDTIQGYRSILLPKLRYGLSATNVHQTNLTKSQQILTQSILPKLGYNRHTPSAIVYAPQHFGGIGLLDMSIEQGVAHITFLVSHLRARTTTATTIINLLESYMVATGTIISPLCDTTECNYISSPWIETTKAILRRADVTITTPRIQQPKLLRARDKAIMHIATIHKFSIKHLRQINACRTWLQVTNLSDIATIKGDSILNPAITGESDTTGRPLLWTISQSKLTWPHQPKPHKQSWKHWRKFMSKILLPKTQSLRTPLGSWYTTWNSQRIWNFSIDRPHQTILQHKQDGTLVHYASKRRNSGPTQLYTTIDPPTHDITQNEPVTPLAINSHQIVIDSHNIHTPPPTHIQRKIIPHTPPHINTQTPTNTVKHVALCIHTKHEYEHQTFAWTLSHNQLNDIQNGPVQYLRSRHCSPMKGNLICIMQALQHLREIPSTPNTQPIAITIFSMDKTLLTTIKKNLRRNITTRTSLQPEQDLLVNIVSRIKTFHKCILHHVTKNEPTNTRASHITTICLKHITESHKPIPTTYVPNGEATVWLHKEEISINIAATVRNAASTGNIRHYMQNKYHWNKATIDNINWIAHAGALHNLPQNQRKTMTQLIHEWLPVNGHPGRQLNPINKLCPHCKQQIESQEHFFSCNSTSLILDSKLTDIIDTISNDTTNTELRPILHWALIKCRVDNKKYPITDNDIPILKLIQAQEAIGWNQVLKGRWSVEWVKQFETTNPSRGEAIVTNLLTQIWKATLAHWTARCDLQHQKDASSHESCLTDLTQQVQAIYQQKQNLDLIDQQPLNQPIDNIMKMPVHIIRKWIKSTESFVKLGLQRAKKRAKHSNQTITNFFRPTRPRTENNNRDITIVHTTHTNPDIPLHPNAQENQRPP